MVDPRPLPIQSDEDGKALNLYDHSYIEGSENKAMELAEFCDRMLEKYAASVEYSDITYPPDRPSFLQKVRGVKVVPLRELMWLLDMVPQPPFSDLTIQKQFHPDEDPQTIRYAITTNSGDSTKSFWINLARPDELKPGSLVMFVSKDSEGILDPDLAIEILDTVTKMVQTSSPLDKSHQQ